ncbi:hypothetical protein J6590_102135, partial [Homalodisca vitripennis]
LRHFRGTNLFALGSFTVSHCSPILVCNCPTLAATLSGNESVSLGVLLSATALQFLYATDIAATLGTNLFALGSFTVSHCSPILVCNCSTLAATLSGNESVYTGRFYCQPLLSNSCVQLSDTGCDTLAERICLYWAVLLSATTLQFLCATVRHWL